MIEQNFTKHSDGTITIGLQAIDDNRTAFQDALMNEVATTRDGVIELLDWLSFDTDFYSAPCSTVYHLCIPGGLTLHSLKVYEIFDKLCDEFYPSFPQESRAVCALLHDLCKVNTYRHALKSRKTGDKWPNGKAIWEDYMAYDFDDPFPYGHGEKSVYLIMKHFPLTDEEAMAIRWHMGGYDSGAKADTRTLGNATTKYPVINLLHAADLIATGQGF